MDLFPFMEKGDCGFGILPSDLVDTFGYLHCPSLSQRMALGVREDFLGSWDFVKW